MSQRYHMDIVVVLTGVSTDKIQTLADILEEHWDGEPELLAPREFLDSVDWSGDGMELGNPPRLWLEGEGSLSCETNSDFTERLTKAIWDANGAYVLVTVTTTYLESLLCEIHCLDKESYAWYNQQKQKQPSFAELLNAGDDIDEIISLMGLTLEHLDTAIAEMALTEEDLAGIEVFRKDILAKGNP